MARKTSGPRISAKVSERSRASQSNNSEVAWCWAMRRARVSLSCSILPPNQGIHEFAAKFGRDTVQRRQHGFVPENRIGFLERFDRAFLFRGRDLFPHRTPLE